MSIQSSQYDIDPTVALQFLRQLDSSIADKDRAISALGTRSLAQINADLSSKPGMFSGLAKGIWGPTTPSLKSGSEKIESITGATDLQTYLVALRGVFSAALENREFHKQEKGKKGISTPQDVLNFVLRLEEVLAKKIGQDPDCEQILADHCIERVHTCRSVEKIKKLFQSPEGQLMIQREREPFIRAVKTRIEEIMPEGRATAGERLAALYSVVGSELTDEEEKGVQRLAETILLKGTQAPLSESFQTLKRDVIALDSVDIPIDDTIESFATIVDPLGRELEQELREKFAHLKDEQCASQEELQEKIYGIQQELIIMSTHRIDAVAAQLEGLPKEVLEYVQNRILSVRLKAEGDFALMSGEAVIAFAASHASSSEELLPLLEWTKKELETLTELRDSPQASSFPSLDIRIAQLARHIEHLTVRLDQVRAREEKEERRAAEGGVVAVAPAAVVATKAKRAGVLSVARRSTSAAIGVLTSVSFLAIYGTPMLFAAISGYKADGYQGAAMAASASLITALLSRVGGSIANSTVQGMLFLAPGFIKRPIGWAAGCYVTLVLTFMSLNYNDFLAGAMRGAWSSEPLAAHIIPNPEAAQAFITSHLPASVTETAQKSVGIVRGILNYGVEQYRVGFPVGGYATTGVQKLWDFSKSVIDLGKGMASILKIPKIA